MATPDINSFRPTGDPKADLARWEAMGGTKEQLQAAFGDPERPNSTFTAEQQFPPMPPNGNIWGGQMPMMGGMIPQMGMMGGMSPMFPPHVLDFSTTASTSSTSTSSTSSSTASTKKTNIAKGYGKTDEQKTHMQEDNYQTYITKAESTELTKQERKDIKKQTKAYLKEMEQWRKEYKKSIKDEIKAAHKGKSNDECEAINNEFKEKTEAYVKAKFKEKYPDVDYYAVMYNMSEIHRASRESGLFHSETPQLIYMTK